MTWGMWGNTLRGLRLFVETWEFVEFKYVVWDKAEGEERQRVGNGQLWELK